MNKNKCLFKKDFTEYSNTSITFSGKHLNLKNFLTFISENNSNKLSVDSLSLLFINSSRANIHYHLWHPYQDKVWSLILSMHHKHTSCSVCSLYHSLSTMGVLWFSVPNSVHECFMRILIHSADSLGHKDTAHLFYALGNMRAQWLLLNSELRQSLLRSVSRNFYSYGAIQLTCVFLGISKMGVRASMLPDLMRNDISKQILHCLRKKVPIDLSLELYNHIAPLALSSTKPAHLEVSLRDNVFRLMQSITEHDDPFFLIGALQTLYQINYRIDFSKPTAEDKIVLQVIKGFSIQASSSYAALLLLTVLRLGIEPDAFMQYAPKLYVKLHTKAYSAVDTHDDAAMSAFLQYLVVLSEQKTLEIERIISLPIAATVETILTRARPEHAKTILCKLAQLSILSSEQILSMSKNVITSCVNIVYYLAPHDSIQAIMATSCLRIDWHHISPMEFHAIYATLIQRLALIPVAPADLVHLIVSIDTFGFTWAMLDIPSKLSLYQTLEKHMSMFNTKEVLYLTCSLCHIGCPITDVQMLSAFSKLYHNHSALNLADRKKFFILLSMMKYCYSMEISHLLPKYDAFTFVPSVSNAEVVKQLEGIVFRCGYPSITDYTFGLNHCLHSPLYIPKLRIIVDLVDKKFYNCSKNVTSLVYNRQQQVIAMGYHYLTIDLLKWRNWTEHDRTQYVDACLYLVQRSLSCSNNSMNATISNSFMPRAYFVVHEHSLFSIRSCLDSTNVRISENNLRYS